MLEITNVKLSRNTVNTGEKYPYDYPYDFPVSCTRKAEPKK